MKRKNIFQLIQENYNIYEEAKNLGFLFSKSKYFSIQKNCMGALSHEIDTTLWGIIDTYFFTNWKYRLSCLNIHDCLVSLKIDIDKFEDDETIINFLELLENFIKIVNDNEGALFEDMRTFDIKPSFQ